MQGLGTGFVWIWGVLLCFGSNTLFLHDYFNVGKLGASGIIVRMGFCCFLVCLFWIYTL